MMRGMQLGVIVMQTRPWTQLAQDFRLAEELGYSAAYVYDHLTHPTAPGEWLGDGFTTLAAAAGVTERMRLGTMVASATLHSPVALARRAGTVQDVSGGRLVLGLGAGSPLCALADRGESVTMGQMSARLRDTVEGLQAVWAGETQWTGRTTSFTGLETLPLPEGVTPPPLVLAAHGPKALELTARHADGWNTYGGPAAARLPAAEFWPAVEAQVAGLRAACERVGRDPGELRRSLLLGFGEVRPTASVAAYREAMERAEALGFDELIVYGPWGEPGDLYWSDVSVHAEVLSGLSEG